MPNTVCLDSLSCYTLASSVLALLKQSRARLRSVSVVLNTGTRDKVKLVGTKRGSKVAFAVVMVTPDDVTRPAPSRPVLR